jgi:hypothetical protein
MRSIFLFLAALLVFGAVVLLSGQITGVGAVGPPSDNATIPDFPVSEQSQDEIKPQVPYYRQGPTSQAESKQPGVIPDFIGPSEQDKFTVTGNETWLLDVDINMPGWLYIYEYFPDGGVSEGKWIAYKWELLQRGVWRIGSFIPGDDTLEGEHIYGIWFYSDGQWAGEDPDVIQSNRVYWTYIKDQPAEAAVTPIPLQPAEIPVEEATFIGKIGNFISQPAGIALVALVLIGIGVLGFFMYRRYVRRNAIVDPEPLSEKAEPEIEPEVMPATLTGARIALPNGVDIQLTSNSRIIGRGDLVRALGLNELGLISRRHFEIRAEDTQFYIEDLGSTNGTMW